MPAEELCVRASPMSPVAARLRHPLRAIYLEYDAAFDWSPDDPRPSGLADRTQRWLANRHGTLEGKAGAVQDPTIAQLVTTSAGASSPAWDRLTEIARKRKAGG